MKKWYITPSTNIFVDTDTDTGRRIDSEYASINDVYIAPEDCVVKYSDSKGDQEFEVKKGQILVTVYNKEMPHQIMIIDSKDFEENILSYKEYRQKEKEEWAKLKSDGVGEACEKCDAAV